MKPRMLVVEDSPTQAERLRYILEQEGYAVTVSGNGKEALESVRRAPPTLVISDIVMPQMGGYELCRQIKGDPALSHIPVFLVTELTDPQDVIRGLECSADHFILKPYDERHLLGRVKFAMLNQDLRQTDRAGMGVEIMFNGQSHYIAADRLQILNLLLSTYDAAIQRNTALDGAKEEMRAANRELTELNRRLAHESQERRQAEQRLRSILDNLNAFVGELSPDGVLREANNLILREGGVWREDLIGKHLCDIWSFSHSDSVRKALLADIARAGTGAMVRHDLTVRMGDGRLSPVDFMLVPVCDDGGHVVKLIASAIDIAARKEAERVAERLNRDLERSNTALAAKEQEKRAILDNVRDGIVTTDDTGVVLSANQAVTRLFGYSEQDIVGQAISRLLPEPGWLAASGPAGFRALDKQVVQGARVTGERLPLDLAITEYRLNGKHVFIWNLHDCRERLSSEGQLRESREVLRRFKESLDQTQDCIFLFDPDSLRFTYANRGAQSLVGYSEDELLDMSPPMLMPEADEPAFRQDLQALTREHSAASMTERVYRRKDGRSVQVEVLTQWVQGGDKPAQFVMVVRDITERKRSERLLLEAKDEAVLANRAKDAFLATMSHEIRTPLNGLLGLLELLDTAALDADQREMLNAARDSGQGLMRIIGDVLDHAKIEAGKLTLLPEPVSINVLLRRVLGNFQAVARAKGLTMHAYCDPDVAPALLADPVRLGQIVANFVSNAVKFTDRGEVEVRAELLDDHDSAQTLLISVRDTGIGISEEAQTRLFRAFEQAEADTSRLYGGTGLGLAICRRLAGLMGGSVAVQSEAGRGTVMSARLRFPVARAPLPTGDASPGLIQAWPDGKVMPRILAVDDNSTNRLLLANQLKRLGLEVVMASGGDAALALWRTTPFDMLITDCNMPQMDGYALSRAVRDLERSESRGRAWIVAWTANILGDVPDRCKAAEMDDILIKPSELEHLRDMMMRFAQQREQAAPPVSAPPVNTAAMSALTGGNRELEVSLLRDFHAVLAVTRQEMAAASRAGDAARAAQLGHKLKSSALTVGATELARACLDLESAGHAADMPVLEECFARFEQAAASADAYLITLLSARGKTDE
ncbi:PAS domain S-box protein [Paludibacterium paludis]|uniref:Virulence sensor protein BvgS n=1 Tax=Paludibacterium paludis TaxID=1225769 RepID=A0A918P6D1_9NEIS|nr:PAS domain S-box protein [Paludibacterium paludis]GGY22286.1 hypothetical protein GCM10011289_27460 [Paludibacterium paludis]